jgi:hypothetical protein
MVVGRSRGCHARRDSGVNSLATGGHEGLCQSLQLVRQSLAREFAICFVEEQERPEQEDCSPLRIEDVEDPDVPERRDQLLHVAVAGRLTRPKTSPWGRLEWRSETSARPAQLRRHLEDEDRERHLALGIVRATQDEPERGFVAVGDLAPEGWVRGDECGDLGEDLRQLPTAVEQQDRRLRVTPGQVAEDLVDRGGTPRPLPRPAQQSFTSPTVSSRSRVACAFDTRPLVASSSDRDRATRSSADLIDESRLASRTFTSPKRRERCVGKPRYTFNHRSASASSRSR